MAGRFVQLRNDMLFCIGVVGLLALIDNILGGIISTIVFWALQYCNHINAQRVNDAYQVTFALFVFLSLGYMARELKETYRVAAIFVMLFGYLEDVLYYVWFYLTNDLVSNLAGGIEVGIGLPKVISGWVGFFSRYLGFTFQGFPTWLIFANFVSVFSVSGWILWKRSNLIKR